MTSNALDTMVRIGLGASAVLVGSILAVPRLLKSYTFAPWVKTAVWTLVAVVALWVPLGLLQIGVPAHKAAGLTAISGRTFLSGVIVGIGFTLVLSGALRKRQVQ